jgi:hypothetical protein
LVRSTNTRSKRASLFRLGAVDDELAVAHGREEAAIAGVADQGLVATLQLAFE